MLGAKPKITNDDKIVAAVYAREYLMPSGAAKLIEAACSRYAASCSLQLTPTL
jgi:hypothetical protein